MKRITDHHYCYEIVNLVNGKYYRGKRSCVGDPEKDTKYMGSGIELKMAFEKYGTENFKKTILATFDTEDEAYEYESQIVTMKEIQDPNCYNIQLGGRSSSEDHLNVLQYKILHKDGKVRRVVEKNIQKYLDKGWKFGNPNAGSVAGKIKITDGEVDRYVTEEEVKKFEEKGWYRGSRLSRPGFHDGWKRIEKGGIFKTVPKEEVENFLQDGWKLGGPGRLSRKDKVCISNGRSNKFISKEELENYLNSGWYRGSLSNLLDGKVFIHQGQEVKAIDWKDLKTYLQEGWIQGPLKDRKITIIKGTQSKKILEAELTTYEAEGWKRGSNRKGRIYINDGSRNLQISLSDLDKYLQSGWKQGFYYSKEYNGHKSK